MTIRMLTGDCRDVLKTLPDESVHMCVTSPPYYGLRDYGTTKWEGGDPACDHTVMRRGHGGEKQSTSAGTSRDSLAGLAECRHCGARRIDAQIGLEPTIAEYVEQMVAVFREVRRVLRSDGTCWINLGDGFKDKQLIGMPWRVAFALQADGWVLRQEIIWSKMNPMPESVTDRCTKAHESLFLLSKSSVYFYDAEAIKEDSKWPDGVGYRYDHDGNRTADRNAGKAGFEIRDGLAKLKPTRTRNKRSVWEVATAPFKESHFATMPPALIEPCILAGTSAKGCCAKCGAPWRRETETETVRAKRERLGLSNADGDGNVGRKAQGLSAIGGGNSHDGNRSPTIKTIGWSPSCTCHGHFEECDGPPDWISEETGKRKKVRVYVADVDSPPPVPTIVLDPFFGAGTTGLVADRLQRDCIGIDLNPAYSSMARNRLMSETPLFTTVAAE